MSNAYGGSKKKVPGVEGEYEPKWRAHHPESESLFKKIASMLKEQGGFPELSEDQRYRTALAQTDTASPEDKDSAPGMNQNKKLDPTMYGPKKDEVASSYMDGGVAEKKKELFSRLKGMLKK